MNNIQRCPISIPQSVSASWAVQCVHYLDLSIFLSYPFYPTVHPPDLLVLYSFQSSELQSSLNFSLKNTYTLSSLFILGFHCFKIVSFYLSFRNSMTRTYFFLLKECLLLYVPPAYNFSFLFVLTLERVHIS